jgi:hypothetical protein
LLDFPQAFGLKVAIVLALAQLFEHAHLAIGLDEGQPAALDLGLHGLALAAKLLPLRPQQQIVAAGVDEPIDVEGSRGGGAARLVLEPDELLGELFLPARDDFVGTVRLAQLRTALVASRLA